MMIRKKKQINKIVLLAPPMKCEDVWGEYSAWAEYTPPLGLCYIGSYIRSGGYDVSIVDAEACHLNVEQAVKEIVDLKPDVVGITCKTLWVKSAHRVAGLLKEQLPDVVVVAGGHHPSSLPEQTMQDFPAFDILVRGEGEITFYELLEALKAGKDLMTIEGLAFKHDGLIHIAPVRERIKDLDILPPPAIDLLKPLDTHYRASIIYAIKGPIFPIMTSRGCPGQCTFCDRCIYGNRVTYHSPEYVMSLIEELYTRYNVRHIMFADDNFLLKRSFLNKLCDFLRKSKMKIKFTCEGRIDNIDKAMLKKLKSAGCVRVMYGIESANTTVLKNMKKGISIKKAAEVIRMTKRLGLMTIGLFILGFPGETKESLEQTYKFIHEMRFDDMMCWYFLPLPGSSIYNEVGKWGTHYPDYEKHNGRAPTGFIPHGLTPEILKEYHDKYMNACYSRFYQIFSLIRRCPTKLHYEILMKEMTGQTGGDAVKQSG